MTVSDDLAPAAAAWAPASLSNLGPGFDSLGVAISGLGDRVEARRTRKESVVVIRRGDAKLPTDPRLNTASVASLKVLELAEADGGVRLEIDKGIPFGSGLGGSAASAAAGAVATNAVLGSPLSEEDLVEATLAGESVASGSTHGDNAIPALLGGVILVDSVEPRNYRRIQPGSDIFFAIVAPELQVETSLARRMLPAKVPLADAVRNASSLAWLLDALRDGDLDVAGKMMMRDTIVEPVRSALIPCYQAVKDAAILAGAPGCGISGSGPAVYALCRSMKEGRRAVEAMVGACSASGFESLSLVASVDDSGARVD